MYGIDEIEHNPQVSELMNKVRDYMATMGAITHDEAHARHVSALSARILTELEYPEEDAQVAAIAGYLHDIGNVINRYEHGRSGALLAFQLLTRIGMPVKQVAVVMGAIGNHEEVSGNPVSDVAAAVILADKSNVHRSRVNKGDIATFTTRDRVNYAAEESRLEVDRAKKEIVMHLKIDTSIVAVMDYFEIFLTKMLLCRRAANFLNCRFGLVINGSRFL